VEAAACKDASTVTNRCVGKPNGFLVLGHRFDNSRQTSG